MQTNLIRKKVLDKITKNQAVKPDLIDVIVTKEPKVILSGKANKEEEIINAEINARTIVGTAPVLNRIKTINHNDNEKFIEKEIERRLVTEVGIAGNDFYLKNTSENKILLSGKVDTYWKKIRAEEEASKLVKEKTIENRIKTRPTYKKNDQSLKSDIHKNLAKKGFRSLKDLSIRVKNGMVILKGSISDLNIFSDIYDTIIYTYGVRGVVNKLSIQNMR